MVRASGRMARGRRESPPAAPGEPWPRGSSPYARPMADAVRQMFGRIAGRYDLVNRVMSARRDVRWRDAALAMLAGTADDALDLACGTFDLALAALAQGKARRVHGCDFCAPMLVA